MTDRAGGSGNMKEARNGAEDDQALREKASTALLDVCLLVAEDGQRRDAGEAIGYGFQESRCKRATAALIAWAPAALRERSVSDLSPAVLAAIRQVVAAAMVRQWDIDAAGPAGVTDKARTSRKNRCWCRDRASASGF